MAVADFKPTLGMIELSTSGSILTGNNAAFCAKFLDKGVGGAPVSLESLTYVLPGQNREGEGQSERSSVVVNLLMQLRASCDQNNFFLRTGQAAQAQVTARLHQVLGQCGGAARTQAGEIERAIRTRLVQEEEFSRALQKLERELKKNNVSLNQPLPEKETGRWSGSPFRQEKGRTARPEGPRNFLRIQMHRSELLWSIGMRQEERAPRRTESHPDGFLKTEKRIFSETDRPGEEGRGEQLAYLQKESGAFVPEPLQKQEKELSRPAGKRRKGGKSPEKRRESQTVQVPETERITLVARPSENYQENRTGQIPESMPPEARLLPQSVSAERYIYRDNIYRPSEVPGSSVHGSWRQILERNGPAIYRQLLKRSGPEIHWQTLGQTAGGPLRREFLPSVTKNSFQQAFPQYVPENFTSEPPQSGLRSLWFKLPWVSQKIWRQTALRRYGPVNWKIFQSIPAARIVPTGKDGTVQFVPVFRREQLSGETDRTIFSVRELWTHSNNISILGRERPVREHIAEEYKTEQYTVQNGPSPEARLLSRPVRAEQYIYRDNVYRSPEVPDSSVHGSRRQILEGTGPEIYRQLLKRRGPEIHWQTLGQSAGDPLRREFLPSVTKSSFQQAFPQYVQENFPSEPLQSGLRSLWFKLPRVSQKIWLQTTLRRYAPVNRQIFQSISAARIVPAGKDGAVQFVPALRREQLPEETGGITVSVREIRTHSNKISILGRERPVREHITEEYTTEKYAVQNGPSPEAWLLSRLVRAERYIYCDNVYRPSAVPGGSMDSVWKQALRRAYALVNRQMFRSVSPARIVPAGVDGTVQFVPVFRREQLPGETDRTIFSVRELWTRSNNIFILGRERPVREHIAEEYTTEKYTTRDSQSPEARLLSQPVRAEQYIYRDNVYRPSEIPGGSMDSVWKQALRRAYAPVNRQMFRSVSPAWIVPEGKDGTVQFVPLLRREQLPGKTGRTVFSVREIRTHFNNISILGRERPVREHIAEEYKTEQYTAQDSQPSEVRLLSQPAAAGRYRYLTFPWPADVPGWRAGRLRQPKLEQNIPGLYRQGPVRGEGAKLILRRVVDWAKELVRGPAERTVPGRNSSSGMRPEPPFSGEAELRYTRSVEKRREQEPAILPRPGERAGARRVPLWRILRSVERRTSPELWKTEDFLRETWTKNHILYRTLRQKNEAKAEGPKTLLYTEREKERETLRRNSVSEPQSPSLSPRLTHFAQPLEAAEGTMPELPACRVSEDRPSAGAPGRTEGSQAIVYRSHARPVSPAQPQAASPAVPGQLEGENVFRAQTVSDGQVRAMERAFSYQAPGNRREESERSGFESAYAPRAEESINYNRLTEEILVRLERRLRAERRKFGL